MQGRAQNFAESISQSKISLPLGDAVALSESFHANSRAHVSNSGKISCTNASDQIGNGAFHSAKIKHAAQQHENDAASGRSKKGPGSQPLARKRPAKPFDYTGHRV